MCFKTKFRMSHIRAWTNAHFAGGAHIIPVHVSSVWGYFEFVYNFGFSRQRSKADINDLYLSERVHSDCAHCRNSRFLGSRSPFGSTGAGLCGNVLLVCFSDTDDCITTHINKTLSLQGEIKCEF